MNRRPLLPALLPVAVLVLAAGCGRTESQAPVYDTAPVARRDIVVSVEAAGQIEPALTVELKSKASGQILELEGETGQLVPEGTLLVQIDKRNPRNSLAQAEATLQAARARRSIAQAQARRADQLLKERIINEVDHEQAQLESANAQAEVVRSQVAVETARIQLDDTDVRAPITGTIIEKLVEEGQVISSPIMDVGGGTLLLKMADLSTVQVRTLVDETDIGKIIPGQSAVVTVTAFPNQPFDGRVEKIEPQANADETVTTFAVQIKLDNSRGLLKPGMNADVEILVAERRDVLAVPTAALRTDRDIGTSAELLGLDPAAVRTALRGAPSRAPDGANGTIAVAEAATPDTTSGASPDAQDDPPSAAAARPPPAVAAQPAGAPDNSPYRFTSRYWVFVRRDGQPVPQTVVTGITDLDWSEVVSGLAAGDEVFLLPSSGLVESQQQLQQQMRRFTGMPGMGGGRSGDRTRGAAGNGERPAGENQRPARNGQRPAAP